MLHSLMLDASVCMSLQSLICVTDQLTVQSAPTSAMAHAACNLVARSAMSNLQSHLKPESVIDAMHTSIGCDMTKAKDILNMANAGAQQ